MLQRSKVLRERVGPLAHPSERLVRGVGSPSRVAVGAFALVRLPPLLDRSYLDEREHPRGQALLLSRDGIAVFGIGALTPGHHRLIGICDRRR